MEASRLAMACALIERAMGGRDPLALLAVVDGEPGRALGQASTIDAGELAAIRDDLLGSGVVDHIHPSWFSSPLCSVGPEARARILTLMPPELARFAVLCLERAEGRTVALPEPDPRAGLAALALAARMRPPTCTEPPRFLGDADPLAWLEATDLVPAVEVESRWPAESRRAAAIIGGEPGPALRIAALAACLACRADEASGIAAMLPWPTGRAFLAARALWALAIQPAEAEELRSRLEQVRGA